MAVRPIDGNALHTVISAWPESIMYKDWVQSAIATAPTLPWLSNEPLTPEQLREMDGKPVWIEHDEDPQYNHVWMIWNNEIGFRHDLAGYNIFWRAYRYPLVGEDGA